MISNNVCNYFKYYRKVRNGAIIRKLIFVDTGFPKQRKYYRY